MTLTHSRASDICPEFRHPKANNRNFRHSVVLAFIVTLVCTSAHAQPSITIISPKGSTQANPLPSTGGAQLHLKFTVSDISVVSKVRVVDFTGVAAKDGDFEVKTAGEQKLVLNLLRGPNKITLFGYSGSPATINETSSPQANIFITCNDDECGKADQLIVEDKPPTGGGGGSGGPKSESNIVFKSPGATVTAGPVEALVSVKGDIKKVTFAVSDNEEKRVDYKPDVDVKNVETDLGIALATLKLAKGTNIIRAYEPTKRGDKAFEATLILSCTGDDKCTATSGEAGTKLITIEKPPSSTVTDTSFRDVYLTVVQDKTKNIKKIKYFVLKDGKTVVNADDVDAVDVKYESGKPGTAVIPIKFVEGKNTVTFFDVDEPLDNNRQAQLFIECAGDKCATDFLIATVPTNSMNTRVVVGLEQVGASSAESEAKPFLDFFFTNGLWFDHIKKKNCVGTECDVQDADGKPVKVPRLGTWGLIRFSTTPQQTASAAVFPSNFVNQITDPTKVVDLVQSFDYLAGLEVRIVSANGWNWTLLPGIKQKSRLFFMVGGGAISPLNPKRTLAQIFKIPGPTSPQRDDFVKRFGEPPADKTYVGFVPLERDRFYRQWYVGFRFKSLYCDNPDCSRFKNSFPSIVDFGIGQNESVTGGTFRQDGKRSWVMRLDGFYPLPIRSASFLYLYGTVLMKIGQGGPKIENPLFLDVAPGEIQITSTDVFIPPSEQQPSRLNRDYYKIGVGVNLTDLFNRNKTKSQF